MIPALVIAATLALLLRIVVPLAEQALRWPAPVVRPFPCGECRCSFHDARWLAMHMAGQHPSTFDAGGAS